MIEGIGKPVDRRDFLRQHGAAFRRRQRHHGIEEHRGCARQRLIRRNLLAPGRRHAADLRRDDREDGAFLLDRLSAVTPAEDPTDMALSPTLSMIKKAEPTLKGRKVAALVTDGTDDATLDALRKAVEKEGAVLAKIPT